jgi:hypothetical protein
MLLSRQVLLQVSDEIYQQANRIAVRTRRAVADVLLETITRSFAPLPIDDNRPAMNRNVEAFTVLHAELVKQYLGQCVAIHEGELVDHDADPVALLHRIRTRFPDQVVLRRKVEPLPEREIRIRHPRIESD